MEPTIWELQSAWKDAAHDSGLASANRKARDTLFNLRRAKNTWVGQDENKLRIELDAYLRQFCHCSDGPFHYESCPFYTDKNPFADLGALMSGRKS